MSSSPDTDSSRMLCSGARTVSGAEGSSAPDSRAIDENLAESTSCISRAKAVRSSTRENSCSATSWSSRAAAADCTAWTRGASAVARSLAVRTFCAQSIGVNRMKPAMNRLSTTCCGSPLPSQAAMPSTMAARHSSAKAAVRSLDEPSRNRPKTHSKSRKYPPMLPTASRPAPHSSTISVLASRNRRRTSTAARPISSSTIHS